MTINVVTDSFAKRVLDPSERVRERSGCNVMSFGERDRIYSYGTHFVMGETLRNPDGTPRLVLLNGEQYSPSTARHQWALRESLRRFAKDVPTLIVPFPALAAAGIRHDTIQLLDVKPDGVEYILRSSDSLPKGAKLMPRKLLTWGIVRTDPTREDETLAWSVEQSEWSGAEIRTTPDGRFEWHTARHWLGDALFSAKWERWSRADGWTVSRRAKFVSSFDRQESQRLYFLCELPPTKAVTLEDAIEALKPDPVVLAEGVGREVTRQGDMFAVPMPLTSTADLRGQGAVFSEKAKSVSLLGTAHTASKVATLPDGTQYAQGSMYHVPALIGESFRERDHARRRMGDGKSWHLIVKNTVPVRK